MTEVINIYLKELKNQHSTVDESLNLILKIRNGCQISKDKLIKNYLLLVVKIAREYRNYGVDIADLISEGNVGLLTAVDKFDISRGAPFSSCASHWIKASIIRNCIMDNRAVRLPENVQNVMRKENYEGIIYSEMSIDVKNEEGDSMAGEIPDEEKPISIFVDEELMIQKLKIEKVLKFLSQRECDIVKANFGINIDKPMEVEEIANKYGLSVTRINQILRESIKKMKCSHDSLPENKVDIQIISAKYGADEHWIDVSLRVKDLLSKKEIIKCSNKLGGDPIFGTKKSLVIEYLIDNEKQQKVIKEGAQVHL